MFGMTSPSKINDEIIIKAVDDYNFVIMQFIIPLIAGIGFILSILDIFFYKFMNFPDMFIIVSHWFLFLPFIIMTFLVQKRKHTYLFTFLSLFFAMFAVFTALIYDLAAFGHIVVYAYGSMALFMIYVYRPRDLIKLILFFTVIFAIILSVFCKRDVPGLLRSDIINAVFIFILSLMLSMGKFHHLMSNIISNETIEKKNKEIEIKNKMLNETLSKVKNIDREKDTFIANISHELKTPIAVISGYISIFKRKNIFKGEDKTRFESMDRNVKRLLNTVNELLDIVGLESGEKPFEMKNISIIYFKERKDKYYSGTN
jgi:signal transduction histidine kinase